jgi:hypothetical protein
MSEVITRTLTVKLEYIRTTELHRYDKQPRMTRFLSLNSTKEAMRVMGLDRKTACITVGNKSYLVSTLVPAYFAYAKKINS